MQCLYNHWLISKAIVAALKVYIGLMPSQILCCICVFGSVGVNTYKQGV